MLKPEHLVTLREVIRLGSFAAAANRLGYTASAVSQQISSLERETGALLFHRTPRSIVPTEAARIIDRHAVTVLSDIDRLVTAAGQAGRQPGGTLRLGIFASLVNAVLPDVRAGLPEPDRGGIRLAVGESSELVHSLGTAHELDAAIVYQVGQAGLSWPSSLSRQWLAEDPFCVAFPAEWSPRPEPPYTVEQFVDLPWIMHRPGTGDAAVIDALFTRWEMHPRIVGHCDDFTATLTMVGAGIGAALLPELAATPRDNVVFLRVPWLNISRSIFALVREDHRSPLLAAVLDAFAHAIRTAQDNRKYGLTCPGLVE